MKAGLLNLEIEMAGHAIWQAIAPTTAKQLIAGYSELIRRRIDDGFNSYLLTFMFRSLHGSAKTLLVQMNDEVQRVYSTFVTRVVRNPKSDMQKDLCHY